MFGGTAFHGLVQHRQRHHDRLETRRSRQLRRAARRHHDSVLTRLRDPLRPRRAGAARCACVAAPAIWNGRRCRARRRAVPAARSSASPRKYEMRCVCSVSGRSLRSQVCERRRDIALAVEIDRKRQRIHHGATAALPDIRRQGMRGIADNRDPAGRPAFELDQIETVVTALLADAVDQAFEMRERALPIVLAHRHRFGGLVAVEHGQRDIDVGLAARRVEHAARARPIFDGLGAVGRSRAPPRSCPSGAACSRRPDICASPTGRASRAAANCCRRRRRRGRL